MIHFNTGDVVYKDSLWQHLSVKLSIWLTVQNVSIQWTFLSHSVFFFSFLMMKCDDPLILLLLQQSIFFHLK